MSAPKWMDETSYSRGETSRVPRTWALRLPDLRVVVTRHIHTPGTWLLVCESAGFDLYDLATDDADAAKTRALRLVRDRLTKVADYARHACEWQEAAARGGQSNDREGTNQ